MNLKNIELIGTRDAQAHTAFREALAEIAVSNDRNKSNYANLLDTYTTYDSFSVLFEDERFVAFSGVQSFNFPGAVCRLLSRTYYAPHFRMKGLGDRSRISYARHTLMRHQLNVARRRSKLFAVISVEMLRRRPYLQRMAQDLTGNGFGDWYLPEGMFLTCPAPYSKCCWQNIAVLNLMAADDKLDLPSISAAQWSSLDD
jgi:hypothetical protein